jgi:hypothetical protein
LEMWQSSNVWERIRIVFLTELGGGESCGVP